MIAKFLIAFCLVAITVLIHAAGLGLVLSRLSHHTRRTETRFWPITWLLIRITWWLILVHVVEIVFWGLFFWSAQCLPDAESSFYFSGVTYATLGYGDVLLLKEWRMFGPLEALTGSLMVGLSIAFFFAVVSGKVLQPITEKEPTRAR